MSWQPCPECGSTWVLFTWTPDLAPKRCRWECYGCGWAMTKRAVDGDDVSATTKPGGTVAEEVVTASPKVTVGFERKVQVREYESAVGSIFISADIDPSDDAEGIAQKIKDAWFQAKAHVFEQLGIEFTDENGVLVEVVKRHFQGAVEVQGSSDRAVTPTPINGVPHPVFGLCKSCGGNQFWDNREKKASGQFKAKSPDGKCRKEGCGNGVWLGGGN